MEIYANIHSLIIIVRETRWSTLKFTFSYLSNEINYRREPSLFQKLKHWSHVGNEIEKNE